MSREVIAVDIDEVLFPFVSEFVAYDNDIHGGKYTADSFDSYQFDKVLGTSLIEAVTRVYDFNAIDHQHISPLEDSKNAVLKLSQEYDLAIVTARHPRFEDNTIKWLDEHLDGLFGHVRHIGYAPVMEKPLKKIDICQEIGAIALIDDSVEHVSQCAAAGVEGLLFGSYPWNQAKKLPPGVVRCHDWPAVLEYFYGQS